MTPRHRDGFDPDGRQFMFVEGAFRVSAQTNVVLNWDQELEARVQTP